MTDIEPICPECGRPQAAATHGHGAFGDRSGPGSRRNLALGSGLALALIAALVLVVSRPGESADDGPLGPDEADPVLADPEAADPLRSSVARSGSFADLTLGAGTRAAYASTDGLVIVETESGAVDLVGVALVSPELAYSDPFVLVADDRRTLAVHPAAPDDPFVLATNYRLVATAVPEQYVFVPAATGIADADEVFLGQAQDGSFGQPITLPPGSRRLAASGVGMLVAAPDGTTYTVGFGGLEPLSDANVIAAAGRHRLEVRCDELLVCRTDVVDDRGGSVSVADDIAGQLGSPRLSPDGAWIAGRNGAAIVIVEVATGMVREIESDDAIIALAWAPDSDVLIAMTGPRAAARLVVVAVGGEGGTTNVELVELGAPPPIGAGLVAF